MAKFEKRQGAGRQRSSGSRGDIKHPGEERKETSGKKEYKAKRSFTRNKSIRDKQQSSGDKPYRPFNRDKPGAFKNKFKREETGSFKDKPERNRAAGEADERRAFTKGGGKAFSDRPKKPFAERGEKAFGEKPRRNFEEKERHGDKKPRFNKREAQRKNFGGFAEEAPGKRVKFDDFQEGRAFSAGEKKERYGERKGPKKNPAPVKKRTDDEGLIRLNKYLSNAGIASRREADILIQGGTVKVNGVVVDQLGYKIKPGDKVTYGDAAVKSERKVYLLLNKPKDYITTLDDPQERKTVMELIEGACRERVYPVGRLDRNTTGLLLFTNDGEITTRLTHPKFGVKKIYHVSLNKGLKPDDFKAIIEGVELEDGFIKADDLAFVGEGKKEVGIEIHSGRNRIVRRLFEHLGYDVLKLDRVAFAGLTKKDLPRGKYRFLTAKEIGFLHMVG